MIRILHDTVEGYPFIASRLGLPCVKHYSPQVRHKFLSWIIGALRVVSASKRGDVIVAVYDFQGILCWLFSLLLFKRCKILCINILLKDKHTLKNRVVSWVYRRALLTKRVTATVTSNAYRELLNRKLGIEVEHPLLRDVYYDSYEPSERVSTGDGSVFCGGRNSRDWDLMFQIAEHLPEVKFRFVMPGDVCDVYAGRMLSNVVALHDVPQNVFLEQMSISSVIAMPLTSTAPAGLIVMFQAAGYERPIISTYTPSTCEYLTPNHGYLLKDRDLESWCRTIKDILNDYPVAQDKARRFHKFVTEECGEAQYVAEIERIIRKMLLLENRK